MREEGEGTGGYYRCPFCWIVQVREETDETGKMTEETWIQVRKYNRCIEVGVHIDKASVYTDALGVYR